MLNESIYIKQVFDNDLRGHEYNRAMEKVRKPVCDCAACVEAERLPIVQRICGSVFFGGEDE